MKKIAAFFSGDDGVNEDTVMGVFFSAALIAAIFIQSLKIPTDQIIVLASLVGAFFGLGKIGDFINKR